MKALNMMKKTLNAAKNVSAMRTYRVLRNVAVTNILAWYSTVAMAQAAGGINLPMGDFFCKIAGALQSQWAPGIILIVIIIEAFLFMVVKKGVLQMLMIVVMAASLALGAGSFLRLISPNAACAAVQ